MYKRTIKIKNLIFKTIYFLTLKQNYFDIYYARSGKVCFFNKVVNWHKIVLLFFCRYQSDDTSVKKILICYEIIRQKLEL